MAEEEDVCNSAHFLPMVTGHVRRSHALGTLSEEGCRWTGKVGIDRT